MDRQIIWQTLRESIIDVFPEMSNRDIGESDSLKELGANSIDRAEIIMLTMNRTKSKIPLVAFASAKNIGEIIDIFLRENQIMV